MAKSAHEVIAVIGAGSIGVAWTAVFANAGSQVVLHDPDPARLTQATDDLSTTLAELAANGLLDEKPEHVHARVAATDDIARALRDATYVQECAPEKAALKRTLFDDFARKGRPDAILASSSSAIPISAVVGDAPHAVRSLVVHPLNPPFLLRVVELVPSRRTNPEVVRRAEGLMRSCGMSPLTIGKEIEGFLFNRLQGALLREAYCLVRDGIASVEQIDRAITDGLGMRWSVIGAFETVDLNTRGGIASHAEKMGPAYARMGAERGQNDPWTDELVATVAAQRRDLLPLEAWAKRVRWRDSQLMELARLRRTQKA